MEEQKKAIRGDPRKEQKFSDEKLVRILAKDIEGGMHVYAGLTKIKGISWAMSNAICHITKIPKRKKIGDLTQQEIEIITDLVKKSQFPQNLVNRKNDRETGQNKHLTGVELELAKEFDIKRHKKIKSYKGSRHATGQPVRGQRTKAHFRVNKKKSVGMKQKVVVKAPYQKGEK